MEQFLSFFSFNAQNPLIFTGFVFWIFFAIVLVGYSFVYKNLRLRSLYLFAMSLFFYYKSSGIYFNLLIISTIIDYFIGQGIYKSTVQWKRKSLVALSVIVNVTILAYFKYSYFLTDLVILYTGEEYEVYNILSAVANELFGSKFEVDNIILPVGISFYTFQTISYSVDIYRKRIEPVKNIIDFGFYVSFFPQLVAGPIVRANEFIPQIYQKYKLSQEDFGRAIYLILMGLMKKMMISDYISINFVDRIFDNPTTYSGIENLLAVYGYAIQIYCDFSGYTDIAIGLALLLGFQLPVNFRAPYKANNVTDFWRRWHISLSSWLKDYLYISLGGNRKGKLRQSVNLLLTMLIGGLWHGAHLRFIIWGGLHGLGLVLHKQWATYVHIPWRNTAWYRLLSVIVTFHFVCFVWIFFRAETMADVGLVLSRIGSGFTLDQFVEVCAAYWNILFIMVMAYLLHLLPTRWSDKQIVVFTRLPYWGKIAICLLVVAMLFQVRSSEIQPFIYFQF